MRQEHDNGLVKMLAQQQERLVNLYFYRFWGDAEAACDLFMRKIFKTAQLKDFLASRSELFERHTQRFVQFANVDSLFRLIDELDTVHEREMSRMHLPVAEKCEGLKANSGEKIRLKGPYLSGVPPGPKVDEQLLDEVFGELDIMQHTHSGPVCAVVIAVKYLAQRGRLIVTKQRYKRFIRQVGSGVAVQVLRRLKRCKRCQSSEIPCIETVLLLKNLFTKIKRTQYVTAYTSFDRTKSLPRHYKIVNKQDIDDKSSRYASSCKFSGMRLTSNFLTIIFMIGSLPIFCMIRVV